MSTGRSGSLKYAAYLILIFNISFILNSNAQNTTVTAGQVSTLDQCISYALRHQPQLRQTELDEDINRSNTRIALSGWWPQLNATANLEHYVQQPVVIFPDINNPTGPKRKITIGVVNNSAFQFSATQNLYKTDLLFAGKTARDYRLLAGENTQSSKIDVVVNVSKAYYDVLLSEQQLKVLDEDVNRLNKNADNAYSLYRNGLVDKTDYQRAQISLNNARSAVRNAREAIPVKYAYLKQVMGYPSDSSIIIHYDSARLVNDIAIDTLQEPDYNNRIEYRIMQTNMRLRESRISYYKWSFLPTLSAFYNYNVEFQNDVFSELYNLKFPNSIIGLNLSLPIFQGTKRIQNLNIARLQYRQTQLAEENLRHEIHTEYRQAMAVYKSRLSQLHTDRENVVNAREIYHIITLQYNQGIKTYLDVIVAETDLRTAELNYLDTLFQVLSSTLDVKKARGEISVQ